MQLLSERDTTIKRLKTELEAASPTSGAAPVPRFLIRRDPRCDGFAPVGMLMNEWVDEWLNR